MGMSDDEFWNSDPFFFNERFEEHMKLEKIKAKGVIRIG